MKFLFSLAVSLSITSALGASKWQQQQSGQDLVARVVTEKARSPTHGELQSDPKPWEKTPEEVLKLTDSRDVDSQELQKILNQEPTWDFHAAPTEEEIKVQRMKDIPNNEGALALEENTDTVRINLKLAGDNSLKEAFTKASDSNAILKEAEYKLGKGTKGAKSLEFLRRMWNKVLAKRASMKARRATRKPKKQQSAFMTHVQGSTLYGKITGIRLFSRAKSILNERRTRFKRVNIKEIQKTAYGNSDHINREPSDQVPDTILVIIGGTEFQLIDRKKTSKEVSPPSAQRIRRRADSLSGTILDLQGDEPISATTVSNDKTLYQQYLNAYSSCQANASVIILPIIEQMLVGSNSSMVYDAAWSIYAEFTGAPEHVVGPFIAGMNCIESLEDAEYGNGTHIDDIIAKEFSDITDDELDMLEYYAIHDVLLDLYEATYEKATAAMNAVGLLSQMQTLQKYLMTNDTSILPAGFGTRIVQSHDAVYFNAKGSGEAAGN